MARRVLHPVTYMCALDGRGCPRLIRSDIDAGL